jgi:hypothetical protein
MNFQKTKLAILAFVVSISLFFSYAPAFADGDLATGSISGFVWGDNNKNGMRDANEWPLVNYPVYLQRVGAEVVGTMVGVVYTDETGAFVFRNLEEGQYQVFPDEGDYVLVDITGVDASATIELPVPVTHHLLFLPLAVR